MIGKDFDSILRLVYVDDKYIKFLSSADNHVMYNKRQKRPYVGVLFRIKGHKYYAPLTHPKSKFNKMKNKEDFIRINQGKLGGINLNNMIPVRDEVVTILRTSNISDSKYRLLIIQQLEFLDKNETTIVDKATKLYLKYKKGALRDEVRKRCCNYTLLEKKAKIYNPNYKRTI